VGVELLGMTGAGMTLMNNDEPEVIWASDQATHEIEEAQLALGEGPGLEAFALGTMILEPDLARGTARWPFFRRAALDLGVGALFAFPLQVGVIRLGVLSLYRKDPGSLSDDQLADALVLADVATEDLLDLQAQGEVPWRRSDPWGQRARVHQATGMIAVQLGSSMTEAMARLRAHAFSAGSTIYDIADDVISHRIRFEE